MSKQKVATTPIAPATLVEAAPVATPVVTAPAAPAPTYDELKAIIAQAITDGNDALFNETITKMARMKSELARQAAEKSKQEAESLAGVRGEKAKVIHAAIKSLGLDTILTEVKAKGFTYKLDATDANGVMVTYQAVELTVPIVKTRMGHSGGGGNVGKSKAEYGVSLTEIFDKFATEADKAKIDTIDADTTKDVKAKNSGKWAVKVSVKKAAIAAGLLKPAA